MSKFLLLYRGPATPMDSYTPEQSAEVMKAWETWLGGIGASLVDAGNPLGARAAVADDGSSPAPSDQNGYSIVQANDLGEARNLLKGHPFLTEGKGRFAVEVFEIVPM
jgi:hypothetical protein